ncbi:integrase, catalytic region, zinc finger, CCHC-type containing protein [Tanacetum coccineum]|uniref:Integrase, catalytic region, zinc finger, CCHC-type containing protein n=1 Tax=Tanacetum coccineum TaxID=301880 RepID=A0ABQ5DGC0_9ASTR
MQFIMLSWKKENPPYKFKWTEKTVPVAEGSFETTIEGYMETFKIVLDDVRKQLDAEDEVVQIILTEIDNDIYSTVDACPNSFLTTITTRMAEQHQNEVNEIRAELLPSTGNLLALVAQHKPIYRPQNHPTNYTHNSSSRQQQATTRNRGKAIVTSSTLIYDQAPVMKIYKPTNNNLRNSSNTSRANQDNTPKINRGTGYDNQRVVNVARARANVGTHVVQQYGIQCYNCKEYRHVARECQKSKRVKDAAYHKEKMLLCKQEEAGFQLSADQADWRDDTDDEQEDQELEAHYMYMAQIQEVSPDVVENSRPVFNEPLQKVQNDDDNYNVFANDKEHPEQPESINDTYSMDMSTSGGEVDHDDDDDDDDLARERDLLASLIEKLKCEIDDNKNRNKFLETSNKTLVDKLKSEIEDFKNKNKSLESSNNHFKEANNELSKMNLIDIMM